MLYPCCWKIRRGGREPSRMSPLSRGPDVCVSSLWICLGKMDANVNGTTCEAQRSWCQAVRPAGRPQESSSMTMDLPMPKLGAGPGLIGAGLPITYSG